VENRKTNKKKTDMLRSVGKQPGKSVQSVQRKTRKANKVGRICRKVRFKPGMKE